MTSMIKRNKHNTEGQANIAKDIANGTSFHERKCVELYRLLENASKEDRKLRMHNQHLHGLNDNLRDELEAASTALANAKWHYICGTTTIVAGVFLLGRFVQYVLS